TPRIAEARYRATARGNAIGILGIVASTSRGAEIKGAQIGKNRPGVARQVIGPGVIAHVGGAEHRVVKRDVRGAGAARASYVPADFGTRDEELSAPRQVSRDDGLFG